MASDRSDDDSDAFLLERSRKRGLGLHIPSILAFYSDLQSPLSDNNLSIGGVPGGPRVAKRRSPKTGGACLRQAEGLVLSSSQPSKTNSAPIFSQGFPTLANQHMIIDDRMTNQVVIADAECREK
ncbi:hypothetical protein PCANC_00883 [Puccinia coronata f. sp. avenae]|uniref:Uncharacterized protein n=1 Tax=Puccinia coronata f. sp. avenae TaxID=200324 RepID=A0A2N5W7G7_9BASI|nr:hypothetical protein PCASD_03591 [Puccinia coronata f. sp. avenae]PLW58177.1 hypothetical protein PCANC_00883 [Puccinia coronata f. sp. avenae]